jgi:hypothetical protein
MTHVCTPDCAPGSCPAIWTGPPSSTTILAIAYMTRADSDGRRYYRRSRLPHPGSWVTLRGAFHFEQLNAALEPYRKETHS